MSRSATLLRKAPFPLAMALVLGFGASQALATPDGDRASTLRYCNNQTCDYNCKARGYDIGACTGLGNQECRCFYY